MSLRFTVFCHFSPPVGGEKSLPTCTRGTVCKDFFAALKRIVLFRAIPHAPACSIEMTILFLNQTHIGYLNAIFKISVNVMLWQVEISTNVEFVDAVMNNLCYMF